MSACQSKFVAGKSTGCVEEVKRMDTATIQDICDTMQDPKTRDEDREVTKRAKDLWKMVKLVSSRIPGTPANKAKSRNMIWGMINYLGAPLLYITINPSDTNSPHFCGIKVPLFPFDPSKMPKYTDRY